MAKIDSNLYRYVPLRVIKPNHHLHRLLV